MTLYRNRYRIETIRMRNWDYSRDGMYFVTIIAKPRHPVFGKVVNNVMVLSDCGKVADACWRSIPEHYKNIRLDKFVIMPDHIHGIIIIDGQPGDAVETGHAPSLRTATLGNFVGSFKSAASKKIHSAGMDKFGWQERFYDHIIRDDSEFRRISEYIRDNPKNWKPKP